LLNHWENLLFKRRRRNNKQPLWLRNLNELWFKNLNKAAIERQRIIIKKQLLWIPTYLKKQWVKRQLRRNKKQLFLINNYLKKVLFKKQFLQLKWLKRWENRCFKKQSFRVNNIDSHDQSCGFFNNCQSYFNMSRFLVKKQLPLVFAKTKWNISFLCRSSRKYRKRLLRKARSLKKFCKILGHKGASARARRLSNQWRIRYLKLKRVADRIKVKYQLKKRLFRPNFAIITWRAKKKRHKYERSIWHHWCGLDRRFGWKWKEKPNLKKPNLKKPNLKKMVN
jgi:hypothetical protein